MKNKLDEVSTAQNNTVRHSVSNRVILGLSLIILSFTSLMGYSILNYKKNVLEIDLIRSTHIPLALGISQIQSTQIVFNTLMDSLTDEPNNQLTRDWLNATRKFRPATLTQLIGIINESLNKKNLSEAEIRFLKELRNRLRDVRRRYRFNENKYAILFSLLDMGKFDEAIEEIEILKRSERLLNNVLQGISDDIAQHIKKVSTEAIKSSNTTAKLLLLLGSLATIIGIAIVISTRKLLAPLKHLQIAVSKISSGNFKTQIKVENNDEIGFLATDFNTMAQALIQRDKQLIRSERLATAGRIAAQVTHEIRNPLSSMSLNTDLLKDEIEFGESKEEAITLLCAIAEEIERLTKITEAYLSFARLPSPTCGYHNFNKTIDKSISFLDAQIKDAKIEIIKTYDKNCNNGYFDPKQLRQVVFNLVKNSIEAMDRGGKLEIATYMDNNFLYLEIKDTGTGISAETTANIFDPFFTTKSTGTGLGLAIIRQICLSHGGNIEHFKNNNNQTVFKVSFSKKPFSKQIIT